MAADGIVLQCPPHRDPSSDAMGNGPSAELQLCTCFGGRPRASTAAIALHRHCSTERAVQSHLVLHFDVNKTIVMLDTIQNIPPGDVLNGILSECAWGRQVEGANGDVTPADSEELLSYLEYLELSLPGKAKDMKKKREQIWKKFTEPGEPGEALRPFYEQLQDALKGEGRMVGTKMVIPAFFELVSQLASQGRSFSVVFRTFGSDLPVVQEEFNAFCAGLHPKYPDVRLDGSKPGFPDLRMVPENTGSWYRDAKQTSLVWGSTTLEEDLKAAGGDLDQFLADPANAQLRSSTGFETVMKDLTAKTSKPCALGLRDYFPYWHQGGQHGPFGKPLLVDTRDHHRHHIFFHDNILLDDLDTKIVDVRDKTGREIWPVYAQRYYLCRAEPLLAILDDSYYVRKVEQYEALFHRKKQALLRLRAATLTVTSMVRAGQLIELGQTSKQTYDAWKGDRVSLLSTHFSTSTANLHEEDDEGDGS
eukprot:s3172_g2.t1